jgi:hypothetical protein
MIPTQEILPTLYGIKNWKAAKAWQLAVQPFMMMMMVIIIIIIIIDTNNNNNNNNNSKGKL